MFSGSKKILFKSLIEIINGCVTLPSGPGFGVNINDEALEKFKI